MKRMTIRLSDTELKALDHMARDAGRRATLAASIVAEVLKDDAASHGKPQDGG